MLSTPVRRSPRTLASRALVPVSLFPCARLPDGAVHASGDTACQSARVTQLRIR